MVYIREYMRPVHRSASEGLAGSLIDNEGPCAREGARFVREHIIRTTDRAFDDFAGTLQATGVNRRLLGLDRTRTP
jgi:hypothetical protein